MEISPGTLLPFEPVPFEFQKEEESGDEEPRDFLEVLAMFVPQEAPPPPKLAFGFEMPQGEPKKAAIPVPPAPPPPDLVSEAKPKVSEPETVALELKLEVKHGAESEAKAEVPPRDDRRPPVDRPVAVERTTERPVEKAVERPVEKAVERAAERAVEPAAEPPSPPAAPMPVVRERAEGPVFEIPAKPEFRAPEKSEAPAPVARTSPPDLAPERSKTPVVREIAIRLPDGQSRPVDVHLVDRGGKVQVEVLTDDNRLATSLRENVGDLVERLRSTGYSARQEPAPALEKFNPMPEEKQANSVTAAPERVEVQEMKASAAKEAFQGEGGGNQQQNSGQHQQHQQQRGNRARWLEEMLRNAYSGSQPEEEEAYGGH